MKKMNNKGFSLVELIVVIAIMAVLIGVLAPTLLGNIEKSKVSTDKQTARSLYSALVAAAGDPEVAISGASITASNTTSGFSLNPGSETDFWDAVRDNLGDKTNVTFESKAYQAANTITVVIDGTSRSVKLEGNAAGADNDFTIGE